MTAQVREILIYNNDEYGMASEPLDAYLSQLKENIEFISPHSACWRGYVGTWEIKDNKLFLIDLKAYISGNVKVGLDFIFPNKKEIFADWVDGEIYLPHGKMLKYIHCGYSSIYEKELILKFKHGILVDERLIYNENLDDKIKIITNNEDILKKLFDDQSELEL